MAAPSSAPPLPPLATSSVQMPDERNAPSTTLLPSDSHAASPTSPEEPFSSALTSPTMAHQRPASPHDSTSLLPVQPLRKSLSVDSFVQYVRDEPSPVTGTRQNRGNTGSAVDPPRHLIYGISDGLRRERERARSERSRGASVSTTGDDYGDPYVGDSDVERSDPFHRSTPSNRSTSHKAPDQPRAYVRAGELPLPSRTPTLSTASSASSMSATSSIVQEDSPRLRSTTSMQSMPRRTNVLTNAATGRVRSGSLGVYHPPSNSGIRMVINTQVSTHSDSSSITLGIVGAPGCGKSRAVRKGLNGHFLQEPVILQGASTNNTWSRYTQRVGRASRNDSHPDCSLYVIEIDIVASRLDPPPSKATAWPEGTPRVDGVIICYDASDEASFTPVESLLKGYRATLKLPVIVLACKSDLQRRVYPELAVELLQEYDVGLVEVNATEDSGKDRLRRSFEWILKVIFRTRTTKGLDINDRNPASPDLLKLPPLPENPPSSPPTATPSASSSMSSMRTVAQSQPRSRNSQSHSPLPHIPLPRSPNTPSSPTRTRSTGDLLHGLERSRREWPERPTEQIAPDVIPDPHSSSSDAPRSAGEVNQGVEDQHEEPKDEREKQPRPAQWATLDELLDKLLFLAVSGDDPSYITHFLLTYRRFATPRKVILAMQKRMRQLDNPSGDPMFACFAQMRICHLLHQWRLEYTHDFAVTGTAGALNALTKSIISKTYLLHYGSDLLPFLEMLPTIEDDPDAAWALKPERVDSGESSDEEEFTTKMPETETETPASSSPTTLLSAPPPTTAASRERKSSLTAVTLLTPKTPSSSGPRHIIKELARVAQELQMIDPETIAQQITLVQVKAFLAITPRNWMYYTLVSGKKDPISDPISRFNAIANRLGDWVVSLILCHDKSKARAKQIEKFVDIAAKLRAHNNYSALRAFVAGINNATFPGDETLEKFNRDSPEQTKNLRSWEVLLQAMRSHRAYRLALRNTKGACVPALEVHMSDLIRAHEGNPDFNEEDPNKIHWGKFNMMGRFINSTTLCQAQCRDEHTEYTFKEKPHIKALIFDTPVMDIELQKSRIAPPDEGENEPVPPHAPQSATVSTKDIALLRKLVFW
ncbi:hypothetical protein EYR40_004020 [Pleurotus pulmonarius]|nr:hypothetical protein EYR40_004020 [Pleurotus pulmonarius]KAF4606727.1 hypothetical protein EYR38_000781 [Pleurotus pulmonarius]